MKNVFMGMRVSPIRKEQNKQLYEFAERPEGLVEGTAARIRSELALLHEAGMSVDVRAAIADKVLSKR